MLAHTKKPKEETCKGLCEEEVFGVVESMDTIHCQDALDSPHTDS